MEWTEMNQRVSVLRCGAADRSSVPSLPVPVLPSHLVPPRGQRRLPLLPGCLTCLAVRDDARLSHLNCLSAVDATPRHRTVVTARRSSRCAHSQTDAPPHCRLTKSRFPVTGGEAVKSGVSCRVSASPSPAGERVRVSDPGKCVGKQVTIRAGLHLMPCSSNTGLEQRGSNVGMLAGSVITFRLSAVITGLITIPADTLLSQTEAGQAMQDALCQVHQGRPPPGGTLVMKANRSRHR
ncbi:hypothetical protein E2C01_059937 [Portunus trituberculatus]|uniref:Uncharacterized protein n=1 Tax=Portunus trituberculatus TaxID=210409 RepID=A0A5B7GZQ9_PORTR|nr:hypothetical protein [Portunus trituberculatus]